MKAVKMYGLKDLRVEDDVVIPELQEDEVQLKVQAVGVCGSDIPRVLFKGPHVLPITLGHEFAGEIVKCGNKVKDYKVGDRVSVAPLIPCYSCEWCNQGLYSLCDDYKYYGSRNDGAFAQYLNVVQDNLVKLEDNVPYDWGAMVDPAANAIHACIQANLVKEDTIAVYGMGAIGLFAVQYAKAIGLKTIIAVDINNDKLEIAKKSGATHCINSLEEDAVSLIREVTDGGVSVVLEMSGSDVAQLNGIRSLTKMGRIVLLGISNKPLTLDKNDVDGILRGQKTIVGSWNSFSRPYPGFEWTESAKLMSEKKMNPEILISHRLTLDDVPEMFRKIDEEHVDYTKIMIYPNK